jgi:hypothetical protein
MAPATKRRPAPPDARRDLQKEMAAASVLKHQLQELFGDDSDLDLLRDTIEGETELLETIDRVLEQMARDAANVAGIDKFASTMAARKKRLTDRFDSMETLLLNALDILQQRRVERPLALIFTRAKPAKIILNDEALVPSQFFKTPDPVLSRTDLLAALKDHRDTVSQKLEEIAERVKAGEMTEEAAAEARERVTAAFPPIPGAELEEGGQTIQVKWS